MFDKQKPVMEFGIWKDILISGQCCIHRLYIGNENNHVGAHHGCSVKLERNRHGLLGLEVILYYK